MSRSRTLGGFYVKLGSLNGNVQDDPRTITQPIY